MKTIAIAQNTITKETFEITAFKAYTLREKNPGLFCKLIFFDYKAEYQNELIVVKKKHCFFRYKKNSLNTSLTTNESLKHIIAKEEISKLSILHLVEDKKKINVYVDSTKTIIEKSFCHENTEFRVDIFFEITATEPKEYLYKWGGILILEIEVSHKTENHKKNCFYEMEIPIFETKLSQKIVRKYKSETSLTDEDIYKMRQDFSNMFRKSIFGTFISNPTRKEYLNLLNYDKIYKEYKNKINDLKKIYEKNVSYVEEYRSKYQCEINAINVIHKLETENSDLNEKISELETQQDLLEIDLKKKQDKINVLCITVNKKNEEIDILNKKIQNTGIINKLKKLLS